MIYPVLINVLQEADLPPDSSEGLPFWLLYVLVCVILLLTAFIFLRNKDFRLKLNSFFSGAGRRMRSLRLKAQIKHERAKRNLLFQEVGKKVWLEHIDVRGTEREWQALTGLEARLDRLHGEWQEAYTKIEELNNGRDEKARMFALKLDGLYKEQAPLKVRQKASRNERKTLVQSIHGAEHEIRASGGREPLLDGDRGRSADEPRLFPHPGAAPDDRPAEDPLIVDHVNDLETRLSALRQRKNAMDIDLAGLRDSLHSINEAVRRTEEEERRALAEMDEKIREAGKSRETIQRAILQARRRTEPFFQAIGKAVDRERIPREDLDIFYIQFDEIERRLRELNRQLDSQS